MSGDSKLRFNLTIVGVFAAAMLAVIVFMTMNTSAVVVGDAYSGSGDWVINNPTWVIDDSVTVVDGDIICNANFHVWNSYIDMQLFFDWEYHNITVANGVTMNVNQSTIESYWDLFNLDVKGTLLGEDTWFYWMNWSSISGKAIMNNTHFYYANGGLRMDGTVTWTNGSIRYIYNSFNVTGSCSLTSMYIYRVYDGMNLMGTTSIMDSRLEYIYLFNASATVTVYNTSHYRIYNGILLTGPVTIELCDYMYTYVGITVTNDKVLVKDTTFDYMYDAGFYFDDCDATLNNVTIDVFSGTNRGYWKTGEMGTWEDRFNMAMGIGIWVVGGDPTFVDVDVEADGYGEFNLEYTGSEQEPRVYIQVWVAAVLIDSTEMQRVTGITVHDSYMYVRCYVTATNPGINPEYMYVEMNVYTAGLGVVNYSDLTITGVDSWNNRRASVYGPYISGTAYGGSGYWSSRDQVQIGSAIFGDFSSSPTPMLTVLDMEVDDGSYWFGHFYQPDYSGTGAPRFEDTVLIQNITVNNAWSRVFRFEITTAFTGKRALVSDVRVTDSHFEGLYSQMLQYYLFPGRGTDPTQYLVDIIEDFTFDNNTITDSFYSWTYLSIGSGGNNMPSDKWDNTATIADNEFVDTQGSFFDAYAHWDFVRGKDTLNVLNNNFDNTTAQYNGPFYVDSFDTIRFMGNTLTDMVYGESADFYDEGGSNSGIKLVDWLFKDNTWDNCTNTRWSEVLFLEFGGNVVFRDNEVMNQNGLISIMPWMESSGTASLDIINNTYHDNMDYFVEFGNPEPDFPNFDMLIMGNEVYNNEDFFLAYWGSSSTLNNFDYDSTFVIEENDFHDNMGGIINIWGDVTVKNNTFTNNVGPLLKIDYINLHVPDVSSNAMVNNGDLFVFVAKDRGYQLVAMSLADQTLTCTGTALHLTNMEVTLDMVDIVGAETGILAWNSFVNAYSSNIDGDTCQVVADGLIANWRPIEVYVTWGDMTGLDSDTPVSEALIVFNTATGDYYSSAYAGTDGMLAEELYQEWSVDLAGVYWYSPYNMKVAAAGATNDMSVVLDKNLVDEEMVHLVLWDIFPPVIAITEPFNGAVFAKDAVDAFGFVAEVGSGLQSVEYSVDGGQSWISLPTSGTGDWTITLPDLPDGPMSLMVSAMDVAGNTAESTVTISIDTTPPALSINALPEITNMGDVTITGSVEMGTEVFLNGLSLGEAQDMVLAIDHTLHEGVNVIVVEAKDMAGNMAMETMTVKLDTFEPVLVVTGPAGGIITNMDFVSVTGIVETGATLTVGGTQVVPDESGTFSYDYSLAPGENSIEIMATDAATNVNMVTIVLEQDQIAPNLDIQSPSDGHITDAGLIQVSIVSDDDAQLWLNGRMLSESGSVTVNILLVEGDNMITAKAMDIAGNMVEETITVVRDTEPPSLVITSPDVMDIWTNAVSLAIEGVALGATSVMANDVSADLDQGTGAFTVSVPLSVGNNTVTIEASDGVNVVSQTIGVKVDRDSPTLNVDTVEPTIKTSSVKISGNTEPGIQWVGINYDGENTIMFPVDFDGTFEVTLSLLDGSYDVKVSVTDEFGNTAERSTGGFNVKDKGIEDQSTDDDGFTIEPLHIGLILAVFGIALIIAAYASAHYITQRKREELEESD
jgi:hypothetical protein